MSFLGRLFGRLGSPAPSASILWIYVRCARCGEKIRIRVNRNTDAVQEYDESGRFTHYRLRKEILGNNCPSLMAVELNFDQAGRIVDQQAERCTIIDEQAFAAVTE